MASQFSFHSGGLTQDNALAIWQGLKEAMKQIQNGNASQLRFEELYRNAYQLVLHKRGELLYKGTTDTIVEKLREVAARVCSATQDSLCETIVEEWENHKLVMTMIRDILMYMDKVYCKGERKPNIYQHGLVLFQKNVIMWESINVRLREVLLSNIRNERMGEVIDRVLMSNCLAMLVDVLSESTSFYQEEFETPMLAETKIFYDQEAQTFISSNSCPDYLKKVERRLHQEEDRAESYLHSSTKSKLVQVVQTELIAKHAEALVNNDSSGCKALFTQNAIEDLARMYRLFSRVPDTLSHIIKAMSTLVRAIGMDIVQDEENVKVPKIFVDKVLKCLHKFSALKRQAFSNDIIFSRALKEAFQYFINFDSRAAKYLSLYVDDILRKGAKGMSEQDAEQKLDDAMQIFQYLTDKDVFEEFYKQHLAARLLSGQSGSDYMEKNMIQRLKTECGHQFTSRVEGMFKDMKVSADFMQQYTRHLLDQKEPEPTVQPTILTTGLWPIAQAAVCRIPQVAVEGLEAFTKYYMRSFSGRRLSWCYNRGTAELRCVFNDSRKELVVSTYQMCVMMLFNSNVTLTYKQIKDLTGIPDSELRVHLLSLAHPRTRVLLKNPNNKSLDDTHKFRYNNDYKSQLRRVKIKLLVSVSQVQAKVVPANVTQGRKTRVEAAIVRVMKARKSLDHTSLVTEVAKQLTSRFSVDPGFIKKRIEGLIEREYLERDENNRRVYNYLA